MVAQGRCQAPGLEVTGTWEPHDFVSRAANTLDHRAISLNPRQNFAIICFLILGYSDL